MTSPGNPYIPLIAAIEALSSRTESSTEEIRNLVRAVTEESYVRDRKVEALRRLSQLLIVGIILLIGVAGLNLVNTTQTRNITDNVSETGDRLLEQTFVIAVCQRQNPLNPDVDPDKNTQALLTCIRHYYPDLELPAKVN